MLMGVISQFALLLWLFQNTIHGCDFSMQREKENWGAEERTSKKWVQCHTALLNY